MGVFGILRRGVFGVRENVLLVKYGEVALRGGNRRFFQKQLARDMQGRIAHLEGCRVINEQGRFVIKLGAGTDCDTVLELVRPTLGLVGFCPGIMTEELSPEAITGLAVEHMIHNFGDTDFSFKVETKRADKRFPLRSYELSARVGEAVLGSMPRARVDLHNPDHTLNIEIRDRAYIYSRVVRGVGGLPAQSSGKGVLMLSGGIDSPVAGFLMAKRGLGLEAVYFDSPPFTSERALKKVEDLAQRLSIYEPNIRLHVIKFTEVQTYLYDRVAHDKLTIFMKRAMLRISRDIAWENKAQCVVLGDSLGQVASQTMQAMAAIDAGVDITILRPLAGMDKHEITSIAREIGSYDISIRPFEDCCTVFVAKHPELRPKIDVILRIESRLERLEQLCDEARAGARVIEVSKLNNRDVE